MRTTDPDDYSVLVAEVNGCLDLLRHWHTGVGPTTDDAIAAAKRLADALEKLKVLGRRLHAQAQQG